MGFIDYFKPKKSLVPTPVRKITRAIVHGLRTEELPPDTRDLGRATIEVADAFTEDGYGKESFGSMPKPNFPEQFDFPGRSARR